MTTRNPKQQQTEARFKQLLRELFQFSREELNFGIYRVMNQKRAALEEFVEKTIVNKIDAALQDTDNAKIEDSDKETARQFIKNQLGELAFDKDGNLKHEYSNIPAAKIWQVLDKISEAPPPPSNELRIEVFNRLYDFFSRYYDDGDFMCKRRYAAKDRYAIPYNGEEVVLHWANKDQYYIKTAEYFTRYTFNAPVGEVHFIMRDADLEKDNNKANSDKYFIPLAEKFSATKGKNKHFELPFEYRALTEQEKKEYKTKQKKEVNEEENGKNGKIKQESIVIEALKKLPAIAAPFMAIGSGEKSLLQKHIESYVKRNTADFFIHKNLHGFLRDELAYFINSELLPVEEMTRGNINSQARYKVADTVRQVAELTIDFLAQLENFQKAIWEKKKFITETNYCVTLQHLPDEELLLDVVKCKKQWQEWQQLNCCDNAIMKASEKKQLKFLQDNPTLVIDTVHFSEEFKDKLLSAFEDIDEVTDGVLFHSENWQALNLMQEKYREQVKCIYIDPPYNTAASSIIYKNEYKDSSWLSLMNNRLMMGKNLMSETAIICCAIDDEEVSNLRYTMKSLFEKEIGIVPIRSNPVGRKSSENFSPVHEYAIFYGFNGSIPRSLPKTENELARYPEIDEKGRYSWLTMVRQGADALREDSPTMFYPIYVKGENIRIPKMKWEEQKQEYIVLENPKRDEIVVYPLNGENDETIEKRWHRGWERVQSELNEYRVYRNSTGKITIHFKARIDLNANPRTWWDDVKYASSNHGAKIIKNLFNKNEFDFPKAIDLVKDCVVVAGGKDEGAYILDYFAGSGTTAHAVINLNRENGGQRKFILAEMGEYFNTIILPRIKKVIFTPEWKNGKPKRAATEEESERAPRLIKYHRIESYDDALENIDFKENSTAKRLLDDYTPRYMLKMESSHCATFSTNSEKLENPFNYTLQRANSKLIIADIPQTFIYLTGMQERTRRVHYDGKRRYVIQHGTIRGKSTVVIWRDVTKWQKKDYEKDRTFIEKNQFTEGVQQIYTNDNSVVENAQSITPLFTKKMFGENYE